MKIKNTFSAASAISKQRAAIGLYGHTAAKKLETEAKRNAKWKDRTSNARNSIQGTFTWWGDKAIITLSMGVDYGTWLELAMEKRYAIIAPTIEKNSAEILRGYQRLVK